MPIHREKETKPVRTIRRETPSLTRREEERPIITQIKTSRSDKKLEQEKKVMKKQEKIKDENVRKQNVVKMQRSRTRTRTLSPTEVKQMTKERIIKDYGAAALASMAPQREPSPKESYYKEVEDYEDDFEDYESDFEAETEEEEPEKTEETEKKVGRKVEASAPTTRTENQKREIEEIKQAMKMENDLTKSRVKEPDIREPEVLPILDFSKSRKIIEAKKTAERARQRGRDLLSMITLDSINYSFLDIPSIPYEVYMKMYGKSDTKQVHVQTNEDDMNEETQTTIIEMKNKWVQKPTDALEEKKYRLTKEERLGVGGDDVTEPEPMMGVIDTTRMNEFLEWASDIIISALRKSGNSLGVDKLPNQAKEMHFSDGFIIPNTSDLPSFEGKAITIISYIAEEVNSILTVHTEPKPSFGESIICNWNINDLSKPMKILTASNKVTSVSGIQNLIFAGLADGTLCLWDLKESSALHYGTADRDCVFRSPTYSTAQLSNGHISPVMSVYVLHEGDETFTVDFTPLQVCTLEENGTVIIWSVVQGRNLEEDLGLAHWGKIKLVKSSTFSVLPTLGRDMSSYVTFNALAVVENPDIEMYVANSLGIVSHLSKYGTSMKPKMYKASDIAEATCLEICPFDVNYFLIGCSDGSIRLHSRNQELALISLNVNTADDTPRAPILSLAWLHVRPFVFFALDSLSRIHIWDLGLSDMYPEVTLNLTKKKVTSMKLIQSSDIKQRPYFVLGTKDGKTEIHRLKDVYSNRPASEIHKDVKKFLKYVSILEDLDEVIVLESKVVSAMKRLQYCKPGRGLKPKEIAEFLCQKYENLDGDIETQVITVLQSGIKKGFICGLCNGNYILIGPTSRNMISQCYNFVKHSPKCTCSLITARKRRCCSFKFNAQGELLKEIPKKKPRKCKLFKSVTPIKQEYIGKSCQLPQNNNAALAVDCTGTSYVHQKKS